MTGLSVRSEATRKNVWSNLFCALNKKIANVFTFTGIPRQQHYISQEDLSNNISISQEDNSNNISISKEDNSDNMSISETSETRVYCFVL